jgi:hypothetical protein
MGNMENKSDQDEEASRQQPHELPFKAHPNRAWTRNVGENAQNIVVRSGSIQIAASELGPQSVRIFLF